MKDATTWTWYWGVGLQKHCSSVVCIHGLSDCCLAWAEVNYQGKWFTFTKDLQLLVANYLINFHIYLTPSGGEFKASNKLIGSGVVLFREQFPFKV